MSRYLYVTAALLWLSAAAVTAMTKEEGSKDEAPLGDTVTVELAQGKIEGARTDVDGRSFFSFESIPFAEPPVGDLRLKAPVPGRPWTGVRNGSLFHFSCPQMIGPIMQGSEDCLYLDVYTPRPLLSSNLPVMVWIHGGAFNMGAGGGFKAMPILRKDVVLVVIQYRLSTLGFLSTEDSVLPGNLGLKDQVLALRWVKDNIRALGGDPEKVTIFGQNSGATSVHMHVVSPMSEGLFQRVIVQSAVPWMIRNDHKETAQKVSDMFNCSNGETTSEHIDSEALLKCLQAVPLDELVKAEDKIRDPPPNIQPMLPRVDGEFLPDHPARLLQEGRNHKVDMIVGTTRDEGSLIVKMFLSNITSWDEAYARNFTKFISNLKADPAYKATFRRIFYKFLLEEPDIIHRFVRLSGEPELTIPTWEIGVKHARDEEFGRRVYAYELQHVGEFTVAEFWFGPAPDWMRKYVGHMDDLEYLFPSSVANATNRLKLTRDDDLFVSEIMVDLWTNFAATGNPTPDLSLGFKWTPLTESSYDYLAITAAPSMDTRDKEAFEFWRNLPTERNKMLFPERFQKGQN